FLFFLLLFLVFYVFSILFFSVYFSFLMRITPLSSSLFPYTTLFRSSARPRPARRPDRPPAAPRRRSRGPSGSAGDRRRPARRRRDRKSTRLNSSHVSISYAVFCLKKK